MPRPERGLPPEVVWTHWKEKFEMNMLWRAKEAERLNGMELQEFIRYIKSLDIDGLRRLVPVRLTQWRRWLLMHELSHRMLNILLPEYEIVEKARDRT